MMLRFFIFIKHHCRFIWNFAEYCNGVLIGRLFGEAFKQKSLEILSRVSTPGQTYRLIKAKDIEMLYTFFLRQPEEAYQYFKPHAFDKKALCRLLRNPSFLMMGVFAGDRIIGYFFLRLFLNKQSFTGYLVDYEYQGRGIAKKMGRSMFEIAWSNGFRVFATVSRANVRALAAYRAINGFKIIKELPDNYIYIEYLQDKVK